MSNTSSLARHDNVHRQLSVFAELLTRLAERYAADDRLHDMLEAVSTGIRDVPRVPAAGKAATTSRRSRQGGDDPADDDDSDDSKPKDIKSLRQLRRLVGRLSTLGHWRNGRFRAGIELIGVGKIHAYFIKIRISQR